VSRQWFPVSWNVAARLPPRFGGLVSGAMRFRVQEADASHIGETTYTGLRELTTRIPRVLPRDPHQGWEGCRQGSPGPDTSCMPGSLLIVGCVAEFEAASAYERGRAGQSQVLLVSGAAGIGKTRLVEELGVRFGSAAGGAQVRTRESAHWSARR
jgi:hypothetical protein